MFSRAQLRRLMESGDIDNVEYGHMHHYYDSKRKRKEDSF
tara:strand:- start:96 stop:215 length:120 start_codon:yes stop_codon:yes gene_type:complete